MNVKTIVVGSLDTNCYILTKNGHALIIDPGDEYDKIISNIGDNKIDGVIITHYHFDHIGALNYFDKNLILDRNNLDEKEYNIGNFKFNVIYTPGHKEDSITIYFKEDKIMFTGDFIFKNAIGRTDLPGGSDIDMLKSLNKIRNYPKDIIIYPGHGLSTILSHELK